MSESLPTIIKPDSDPSFDITNFDLVAFRRFMKAMVVLERSIGDSQHFQSEFSPSALTDDDLRIFKLFHSDLLTDDVFHEYQEKILAEGSATSVLFSSYIADMLQEKQLLHLLRLRHSNQEDQVLVERVNFFRSYFQNTIILFEKERKTSLFDETFTINELGEEEMHIFNRLCMGIVSLSELESYREKARKLNNATKRQFAHYLINKFSSFSLELEDEDD